MGSGVTRPTFNLSSITSQLHRLGKVLHWGALVFFLSEMGIMIKPTAKGWCEGSWTYPTGRVLQRWVLSPRKCSSSLLVCQPWSSVPLLSFLGAGCHGNIICWAQEITSCSVHPVWCNEPLPVCQHLVRNRKGQRYFGGDPLLKCLHPTPPTQRAGE